MKKSLICTLLASILLLGALTACAPAAQVPEPPPTADTNQTVTPAEPVVVADVSPAAQAPEPPAAGINQAVTPAEPVAVADVSPAAQTPAPPPAEPVAMEDVSPDDWFYRHVTNGLRFGLIEGVGDGRFEPYRYVTRAEFITMLGRLHEYGNETIGTPGDGEFYTRYLEWAVELGIIQGNEYGDLMPDTYITREQMVVIADRYIMASGLWMYVRYANGATIPPRFRDRPLISPWALTAASSLGQIRLGVSRPGFGGYFRPQDNAIRAEALAQLTVIALRLHD